MAGGSSTNVPTDVAARAAAMEPRPDGRGKARADGAVGDDREAAMEPRPDGRGKTTFATGSATKQEKPQWSPGLMAGGRR